VGSRKVPQSRIRFALLISTGVEHKRVAFHAELRKFVQN
jgi:hypothetical protein